MRDSSGDDPIITILYRWSPEGASRLRPVGFSKAAAYRSCAAALSAFGSRFELIIAADDHEPPPFDHPEASHVELLGRRGAGASFDWCIERALRLPDDRLLYFAEDDYFYRPDAFVKLHRLAESLGPQRHGYYYSLYDHPDAYVQAMYPDQRATLRIGGGHHWRTAPSTCMSFGMTLLRLKRDLKLLRLAVAPRATASWTYWTARLGGTRRPLYRWSMRQARSARGLRSIAGNARRIVGSREVLDSVELLTPVPSLSAHATLGYVPPTQAWADYGLSND